MRTTTVAALILTALLALAAVPTANADIVPSPGGPPVLQRECPFGYNYAALLNACLVVCDNEPGSAGGCGGIVDNECFLIIGNFCAPVFFTYDPDACDGYGTFPPMMNGLCLGPYVDVACGSHETEARQCKCLVDDGTVLEGYTQFWVCSVLLDDPL